MMRSTKSVGRIIGAMWLVQLPVLIVSFVMVLPLTESPAEVLANAAGRSFQLKLAVFLLLANCALTIAISIAVWSVVRQYSAEMALLLVAVSVIMFTLQAVDNAHLLSMLSLSRQYHQAGGSGELFPAMVAVVGSTRKWTHYSELLAIEAWNFVFYTLLFRFALVPRVLAALGLITVALHVAGTTLPLFLGYGPVTLMAASLGLGHLAVALWLIIKGLTEAPHPPGNGARK
jgi:hypothetical protein